MAPQHVASDGPARPHWTWRASPGKLSLQANRNPTQAHGTKGHSALMHFPTATT
jgi:hypothetical protein